MPTTRCLCGATFDGADVDELVEALKAHTEAEHPGLNLVDQEYRNFIEAQERLTGPTERLDEIGEVEVHPVSVERVDDVLGFFDSDGFADNPAWAACYCVFHQRGGRTNERWGSEPWQENRTFLAERIRAGGTTGALAYVDGRLAAWCNASPRTEFPAFHGRDEHPDEQVGCVVCFVVAPPYRRHGLASRLLDAALVSFAERGFGVAEAYPKRQPRSDAAAFLGPLPMYLGAGFREVASDGDLVVVQKTL